MWVSRKLHRYNNKTIIGKSKLKREKPVTYLNAQFLFSYVITIVYNNIVIYGLSSQNILCDHIYCVTHINVFKRTSWIVIFPGASIKYLNLLLTILYAVR